jgi:hypothetical protein
MNITLKFFTFVVAAGLMALTVRGAYALTSSAPVTVVLAALVVLQWAAAKRAIEALRSGAAGQRLRALWQAVLWAAVWLTVATITVSFVGGELYQIFTARTAAGARFDAEQATVQARARDLSNLYRSLDGQLGQYADHAKAMAEQEVARGGSCAVSMGAGPGEIRAFRQADTRSAAAVAAQLRPEIKTVQGALAGIQALRFNGAVPELRRRLAEAVDETNAFTRAPILSQVSALVDAAKLAAADIRIAGKAWRCEDATRELMLTQLKATAAALGALKPLQPPQLLDPADDRAMAQGTLIRTWAALIEVLPARLVGNRPIMDADFKTRFALTGNAVLSESNLPLLLAWVLEFVLVGLLAASQGDPHNPGLLPRVARQLTFWALGRAQARPGWQGQLATALGSPSLGHAAWRAPYVDTERLFADGQMEERAHAVASWYRPYGAMDIIAVPFTRFLAVRAARELFHAGLLRRLATGINTVQLMRDKQLAGVMHAIGGEVPQTVWDVYHVRDPHLARWLLTQPIEARAALLGT